MTIEEFRKLYKSTDDIKALVDSHVEVKNFKACFEYYDHFISYDFSNAFIKVEDENNICINASAPVELEADTEYDKISLFVTFNVTAKTNIYDILTGKAVDAKLIKSNIALDSTVAIIEWKDIEHYVSDVSYILDEDWKEDLIKLLRDILMYDVFKGIWKHSDRKVIYDFILKYLETKYNVTEKDDVTSDMFLEAYNSDECQDLLSNFSTMDLYYWINDLYYSYKDQVNKDIFNDAANTIISNYYDGFSLSEIKDYTDLYKYYEDEDEYANVGAYIKFSFK